MTTDTTRLLLLSSSSSMQGITNTAITTSTITTATTAPIAAVGSSSSPSSWSLLWWSLWPEVLSAFSAISRSDPSFVCNDGCGWIAAIIAALTYGSFGVPVRDTKHIPVHPLVLQSMKTCCFFIFGWCIVVPYLILSSSSSSSSKLSSSSSATSFSTVDSTHMSSSNYNPFQEVRWTWWGLLSGALWVMGGTCGVYGIRLAGLAIATGTWSSIMILVNFIWGIGVFHEPVNSIFNAAVAFGFLAMGVVGMAHFSSSNKKEDAVVHKRKEKDDRPFSSSNRKEDNAVPIFKRKEKDDRDVVPSLIVKSSWWLSARKLIGIFSKNINNDDDKIKNDDPCENHFLMPQQQNGGSTFNYDSEEDGTNSPNVTFRLGPKFSITLTRRTAGLAGAAANGFLSGSSLIPLHYAKTQQGLGGIKYIPSFATGSLLANAFLWILIFISRYKTSLSYTWNYCMPSWHLKQLLLPGLASGTLMSVGMFGSILATTYLGQGVGNSIVQSKILVSGLWGILYFGEIQGFKNRILWFASACLTVSGILLLSMERLAAKNKAQ